MSFGASVRELPNPQTACAVVRVSRCAWPDFAAFDEGRPSRSVGYVTRGTVVKDVTGKSVPLSWQWPERASQRAATPRFGSLTLSAPAVPAKRHRLGGPVPSAARPELHAPRSRLARRSGIWRAI